MPDQTSRPLPEIVQECIDKADKAVAQLERTLAKELAQVGKNPDEDPETVLMRAHDKRISGIAAERAKVEYYKHVFQYGSTKDRIKNTLAAYDELEERARKEKREAVRSLREKLKQEKKS